MASYVVAPQESAASDCTSGLDMKRVDRASLLELLRQLRAMDYQFVTTTPASHARVIARSQHLEAHCLRDVLGWSLPFDRRLLPPAMFELLDCAGVLSQRNDGKFEAAVRVSSLRGVLFLHSAYPTLAEDAVFLGPDSGRFADFIVQQMGDLPGASHILDYAAGAGVGGIIAALGQREPRLTLADRNPNALFLASIDAEHAGLDCRLLEVARPSAIEGRFDLIVTHPPFMIDAEHRFYRDGGELYGARLSLDWVCEAMALLQPGGRIILHTGVSIVNGHDVLHDALRAHVPDDGGWRMDYRELDADIFGEELEDPAYGDVERIAAVGMVLTRQSNPVSGGRRS